MLRREGQREMGISLTGMRNLVGGIGRPKLIAVPFDPPSQTSTLSRDRIFSAYNSVTGLACQDHFLENGYHLKRYFSLDFRQQERGVIEVGPGNWSNGLFFATSLGVGNFKTLNHTDSYATLAASSGFDCWVSDGFSPRIWSRYISRKLGKECPVPLSEISFERTLEKDLPAIYDYISRVTDQDHFGSIAHSKGGLLRLGYVGTTQDPRIRVLQTIATPVTFTAEQRRIKLGALVALSYYAMGLKVYNPIQLFSSSVLTLSRAIPDRPIILDHLPLMWNPANISRRAANFMVKNVSEPLSLQEFWFFVQMILTGEFKSLPEKDYAKLSMVRLILEEIQKESGLALHLGFLDKPRIDYGAALRNITIPVQVFYGGRDEIAPSAAVLPTLDLIGSTVKSAVEDPDAGHVDLWAGKGATMANWVKSLEFFRAHV